MRPFKSSFVSIWIVALLPPLAACGDNLRAPDEGNDPGGLDDVGDDDDSVGGDVDAGTDDPGSDVRCVFPQGYWKNTPEAWPVDWLALGNVVYDQDQLLSILAQPTIGNGIDSLARQLIAAKLNIYMGAPYAHVEDMIDAADVLIGDNVIPPVGTGYVNPADTLGLIGGLDLFNNTAATECLAPPEPPTLCRDDVVDCPEQDIPPRVP